MNCPVCNDELKFDDEICFDNDVYSEEIVLRQWWYCPKCDHDFTVTRHYTQDGAHFENA